MTGSVQHVAWRVLLVGGNSGVGKTGGAQALGRRLGISVLLVDDLRIAVQELTTPTSHPGLHVFRSDKVVHAMGAEAAVRGFLTTATALAPAIRAVIGHHLVVRGAGPLIIEGDGLLPGLASDQRYDDLTLFHGLTPSAEVRMVVVHEASEGQLFENFRERGRGFETLAKEEQAALVHAAFLYGEWLRREAEASGVPVVAARPFETLAERVLAVSS